MRQPTSLTLRLTLLFGVVGAIVFAGFGWFIDRSIDHHFHTEDSAELVEIADAVSSVLLQQKFIQDLDGIKQRFNDLLVGHHHAALYIAGKENQMLFQFPGSPDLSSLNNALKANNNDVIHIWKDNNNLYRVLTRRIYEPKLEKQAYYTFTVAVAIDYHMRFLEDFHRTLWLMIISSIGAMSLLGWIAVRQGHAPLHDIIAQIRLISANKLSTRLSPKTVPTELTDLAESFNGMLERVEESFQRLSNFSDDIAHELRTPVTSMLTQTQVALSQTRDIDAYREILYSNIEEYERMAKMISDMLFIAKTDNKQFELDKTTISLAKEVVALFEYFEAWAEERNIKMELVGDATIIGDKLMIQRVLNNLLSNAIRHTSSGNSVRVILKNTKNDSVYIAVENPGDPIDSHHLNRLFNRFYRVDASRHQGIGEGVGLGLAIVKSIVELHGGQIGAESSDEHTRFWITLPVIQ